MNTEKQYELMPFQKNTVEKVSKLLFEEGKRRVLVADEVGLGKTMVARGVIENLVQRREDKKTRVIYICNNANIIEQNLEKLICSSSFRYCKKKQTRLSMMFNILSTWPDPKRPEEKWQLIPITFNTSFRKGINIGTVEERCMIFSYLKKIDDLKDYCGHYKDERFPSDSNAASAPLAFLMCNGSPDSWYYPYNGMGRCNKKIVELLENMLDANGLGKKIKDACEYIRQWKKLPPNSTELIQQLQILFSELSLEFLMQEEEKDPNSVLFIMDEFQCFHNMLGNKSDSQNESGEQFLSEQSLMNKLFGKDRRFNQLLLSATPYRMYMTPEETANTKCNANQEFLDVVNFLRGDDKVKGLWGEYTKQLSSTKESEKNDQNPDHKFNAVKESKTKVENKLKEHICRTERLSAKHAADIIDASGCETPVTITKADIIPYLELRAIMKKIDNAPPLPLDYVKSCPYLLTFMTNNDGNAYKLKEVIMDYFEKHPDESYLLQSENLWLNACAEKEPIPPKNARLERIMQTVFQSNAEKLLWVPPSKPYYSPRGVFKESEHFTKTLIFSDWKMVPRMLATLLSHEAERRINAQLPESENSAHTDEGDILTIPSEFLAKCYDPIAFMDEDICIIHSRISEKIKEKRPISVQTENADNSDKPDFLRSVLEGLDTPGKVIQISENVLSLLADLAIASPAVCAYRMLMRHPGNSGQSSEKIKGSAKKLAGAFVASMRTPSAKAIIELSVNDEKASLWQKTLTYCKDGNLQAVFDEFAHILNEHTCEKLVDAFRKALSVSPITDRVTTKKGSIEKEGFIKISKHFSLEFSGENSKASKKGSSEEIRRAFNSPFRPFVLSSTSIGQEGLDFHNYCRRVVHWNLPSNPVDLEQREGRVNRYKSLCIRQNVADRYGHIFKENTDGNSDSQKDVWKRLFDTARKEEGGDDPTGLIPYWCLTEKQGMVKIERIAPMYPYSIDKIKYDRLIRLCSLYRLALGQPNQQDFLNLILKNLSDNVDELRDLCIDLTPENPSDQHSDLTIIA